MKIINIEFYTYISIKQNYIIYILLIYGNLEYKMLQWLVHRLHPVTWAL